MIKICHSKKKSMIILYKKRWKVYIYIVFFLIVFDGYENIYAAVYFDEQMVATK